VTVTALACISVCSLADDSTIDIDRIKADAAAAHPTDPVAATKAANEALERRLQQISKTKNDAAAAKELAAIAFLGYYMKNVFEIPSVCKEYGVDINNYSVAFAEANRIPYKAAASVVNVKPLIEQDKVSTHAYARSELQRLATSQKATLQGACYIIQAQAQKIAEGAKAASIMPKIYAQLLGQ